MTTAPTAQSTLDDDIRIAREKLTALDATCVLSKGPSQLVSHQRGVRPLLDWLDGDFDVRGYSAADKVVGNGAAYLYVLLDVGAVYAEVMSEPARSTLEAHGIDASYGVLVPGIVNRAGDGPCPIEHCVANIHEPLEALDAIRARLAELSDNR